MDSARTLTAFGHVSIDGYFVDGSGDMSWAHKRDAEWNAFVAENAGSDSELVFGRTTYQMMAGYWPTAQASQASPRVAERMNQTPKVVFSRTLVESSCGGQGQNLVRRNPWAPQAQSRQDARFQQWECAAVLYARLVVAGRFVGIGDRGPQLDAAIG
jgi:dihydrofolate reductase